MVHALKNSSIPIVTVMGLDLGILLGGTVIIEVVFAWPGVGRLVVEAIANRDFPHRPGPPCSSWRRGSCSST